MFIYSEKWWLIILIIISFYVSYKDIKTRTIPNELVAFIAILGLVYCFVYENYQAIVPAIIILFVGVVLSWLNILGAGDSKLLAVMSLFIATEHLLPVVINMLLLGGVCAGVQFVLAKVSGNQEWMERGVPYGVPICISCLLGIAASI